MKKKIILIVITALFIITTLNAQTKALVIGVGEYKEGSVGDLKTAVKDAEKFAGTLVKLGIVEERNLKLLVNPGYSDMLYELVELVDSANEEDRLIFYYGGHSEMRTNEAGKQDVYLMPSDFHEKILTRTAVNFRREWEEILSPKLKASETVMIFDTCYSGGITEERGLDNFQSRNVSFEAIAEEKGVNFLFSSGANETSLEMPEAQGGWFTWYLLEGLGKGTANLNGDGTINISELSKYVKERVSESTKNAQNPTSILGKGQMMIAEDENLLYENINTLIVTDYLMGKIKEEHSKVYIALLQHSPLEDTPKETKLRNYLRKFWDDRDNEALEAITEKIMNEMVVEETEKQEPVSIQPSDVVIPEESASESDQEVAQPEEEPEKEERSGTNWLTILPGNEMAVGATVYIDGAKEGTLTAEGITVENLEKGTHQIEIDGEAINRDCITIEYKSDWMLKKAEIEAQTAKRKIMLMTTPTQATVKLNGEEQTEKTPLMIEIEIGKENELIITKDSYREQKVTLKEEEKGEPKQLTIALERNKAPNMPMMIAPYGESIELETELEWRCSDEEGDSLTYEIWLGEAGKELKKMTETQEKNCKVTNLKSDTTYNWRIVAKDEWNETEGTLWNFRTRKILTKTYRIESEPEEAALYIDGTHEGTTPQTITLQEGSHQIRIKKENYKEQTKTININSVTKDLTRVETITFELEKETGTIKIETNPSGASVYLNGTYKGTSPYTIKDLKEGYYTIGIKKTDYKERTEYNVRVKAGEETKKNITLEKVEKEPELTEMVRVEGGRFQMGSTSGDDDEKPIHSVTLTYDYWMGKTEVTFAEYDKYCEETGANKPDDEDWGRGSRPVINVSWYEAIAYCNWLSEKEGIAVAYDNSGNLLDKNGNKTADITKVEGYRLPTEAEWEYAARGGNKSKGYTYSGSNGIGDVAWYYSNSGSKTHEVGGKKANELGLYDMSGNVWEWCQDWYGSYGKSESNDPVNLDNASKRVFRGGCWGSDASYCRVANRDGYFPSGGRRLGFRVARTSFF